MKDKAGNKVFQTWFEHLEDGGGGMQFEKGVTHGA